MSRTAGATNVLALVERSTLATIRRDELDHLLPDGSGPSAELKYLLTNQGNFRSWLKRKDSQLADLAAAAAKGAAAKKLKGPKPATTRKYGWYLSQLLTLELLTGFEFFFKTTLVRLADALGPALDPAKFTKPVPAGSLVPYLGASAPSFGEIMYEHQLFHQVDQINEATRQLVHGAWLPDGTVSADKERLRRGLPLAFQVRHTLAHNRGLVTKNDAARFRVLGVSVTSGEYIDTTKDKLYEALSEFVTEAMSSFHAWCQGATAGYLTKANKERAVPLPIATRTAVVSVIGDDKVFDPLPWVS